MEICLAVDGSISTAALRNPTDFTGFRLLLSVANSTADEVAAALASVGRAAQDHVWVAWSELLRLAGSLAADPEWLAGLEQMRDAVRRFGWVDDGGSVRAHIERLERQHTL